MGKALSFLSSGCFLFSNVPWIGRIAKKKSFLLFSGLSISGLFSGAFLAGHFGLVSAVSAVPLIFSGIPVIDAGLLSCFSTFYLHNLICLVILFLLGMTAYGALAIPLYIFLQGGTLGVGALFYLGSCESLAEHFLIYTPAATISLFLAALFACEALAFSQRFTIKSTGYQGDAPDFPRFRKDFLFLLGIAAPVSAVCCLPIALRLVFLYVRG